MEFELASVFLTNAAYINHRHASISATGTGIANMFVNL